MMAQMANQRVLTIAGALAILALLFYTSHHSDTISTLYNPPSEEAVEPLYDFAIPSINLAVPQIKEKAAVIVESRSMQSLIPLLLHFAAVLGPSWPIILYTSSEAMQTFQTVSSLRRHSHQIEIRSLPEDTAFTTHASVSKFLTQPWLWEQLAPADHILLFQADSMICGNAEQGADDFLEYDFIGAPIAQPYGQGYNGGLSIRNRNTVLEILVDADWETDAKNTTLHAPYNVNFEDQWMIWKMSLLPEHRLPSREVAQTFAVETVYYEKPFGYHQIMRWQKEHLDEIKKWCPEVSLTIGSTFV